MTDVSTPETAEMERAVAALALELPGEVWDDVRAKWHAARDSLAAEIEQLRHVLVFADGHSLVESGFPLAALYNDECEAARVIERAGCHSRDKRI